MKKLIHTSSFLLCSLLLGCGGGGTIAQPNPTDTSFTAKTTSEINTMSSADQVKAILAAKKPDRLLDDPEAMKRILGEDKDNDGIRDDMAEWIEKNAEDKDQRSILRADAREFQRELQIRTLADAQAMFRYGSNAINCAYALANKYYPSDNKEDSKNFSLFSKKQLKKREDMAKSIGLNTPERYWRYNDAQNAMHAMIISGDLNEIAKHPEKYCAQD
jgi:L-fucose mutarotase/ribose pyranase (RbsD/FucU family)